ncbi:hypothetical protein TTHERM_00011140 (macronuclear) [Tetrahymena thermophila SB210]|uniref:Protein kinase domain-containing protein n=1 Tax=Tetrahymena thermophila (strain SB210) TaxID=312017 RepID=Q22S24_TETTS|nr:hypothetical protein TTHERM_00011140 [Tetrahymena thermophila SB210]EAR87948.2 hypothetical protein TTHERM_00011140 [Tetrahymena thermophila SB210]|eukprot:XP_001008193.2 hypothetical protein TTHERM_00011140 [Tetrahymena thermophila SB210]
MNICDFIVEQSSVEKNLCLIQPDPGKQQTMQRIKKGKSIQQQNSYTYKKIQSVLSDDKTIDKKKKKKSSDQQGKIFIQDLMQMTLQKSDFRKKQSIGVDDLLQFGDQVIWTENSLSSDEENGQNDEAKLQQVDEEEDEGKHQLNNSVFNYYRQEKYQLQVIEDGNFNNGGVSLQIDFDKKIIKAVKQVKNLEFFQREIKALQEFQRKGCFVDAAAVSLKLLDYDTNNLVFSQKAGFISYKQINKIVHIKKLQDNYKLPFEYFILKQMYFLNKKLELMNNFFKIAHSDIKPNNIVIGFDFIPYFIDLGGAVFIDDEPNEYLTLCTPTFVPAKYIDCEQFDEKSIKECEKQSLMLVFLFMLCRNQDENKLFYQRKYGQLLEVLKKFYSQDLMNIFEKSIIYEDYEGVETMVKEILDNNLIQYVENLDQIMLFLSELKQFDYSTNQNLYVIKEWDQFNINILKIFPCLLYEIDLLEISENQKIYDYFCNNNQLDIFVDINKPFFINFLNIFLELSTDCHTLKILNLSPQQNSEKFNVSDLIHKDGKTLQIRMNFNIFNYQNEDIDENQFNYGDSSKAKVPSLNFKNILDLIDTLYIISYEETIDFKYFSGINSFYSKCRLQEIKIKCKDISINLFQDFLNEQTNLRVFHMFVVDYQYKLKFPDLQQKNQLSKLKSNFQITNLDSVIEENAESLQDLEITINAGEDRSPLYTQLSKLNFLVKISLRVQYIKIPNVSALATKMPNSSSINCYGLNRMGSLPRKNSNQFPYLSQDFYDLLSQVFSKMKIPVVKLNFSESLLNNQDIQQINRCIKSSLNANASQQLNLPHTLKLNLNMQSKQVDEQNTRMILISLFQTKIQRIKLLINNSVQQSISKQDNSTKKQIKTAQTLLNFFPVGYKNESLQRFSLHLSNFNVNIQAIVNNLNACQKYKIILNSYNHSVFTSVENITFLNEKQQFIIKPSDPALNQQFKYFSSANKQIQISAKINKYSQFNYNKIHTNPNLRTFTRSLQKRNRNNSESTNDGNGLQITSNPSISEEQSPSNLSYQNNQRLEDYIDFKSNRLFCMNLNSFKNELNIETANVQDSLSGLVECFKVNQKLKSVSLDFTIPSLSKIIQSNFLQNLFDSFKYNQVVEELSINFSGNQIDSLKCLHGCLSFNETLKSFSLNLQNCNLYPESLMEIAEAVLSNENIDYYKFSLLDNIQLSYPHTIIHELKSSKPNTEIILLFNNVKDYDLMFNSGIVHYSPQILQELEIKQKQRKQLKYNYYEYENTINDLTNTNFAMCSRQQTVIINQATLFKNQSSLNPNSPIFNHRKYSLNKQQQNQISSLFSNTNTSTFSNLVSSPQFLNNQSSPNMNFIQKPANSAIFNQSNLKQANGILSTLNNNISSVFNNNPQNLRNRKKKLSRFQEEKNSMEQSEQSFNNPLNSSINNNQNMNGNANSNILNANNFGNSQLINEDYEDNMNINTPKTRAIWMSRKLNQARTSQYSSLSRHKLHSEVVERRPSNANTLLELNSPQSQQHRAISSIQNHNNQNSLGQILVYHKRKQRLTIIIEENYNIIALEELAKKNPGIKEIKFALNASTLNLKYFLSGLQFNNNLQGISIALNFLPSKADFKTITDIFQVLKEKLKKISLDFSRQKIGQENIKQIIDYLYQNPMIEEVDLDLSHNMIQPNTAKYFCLLKQSNIKKLTLRLGNNFLGIDGTKYICDIIEYNSIHLKELFLGLDFNFIGNSALQIIQNSLTKNSNLLNLNIFMKGNQIKTEFVSFIELYLQQHPSIKNFSIQTENSTIDQQNI